MNAIELQDFLHVYSMFSFHDGRHVPGIVINKYNLLSTQVEYYLIAHADMQNYKSAFENYDKETCSRLSVKLNPEDIIHIRPVSLADYKIIMQLLVEKDRITNDASKNSGMMEY